MINLQLEHLPTGLQEFFNKNVAASNYVPLLSALKETRRSNKGLTESNLLSLSYGEIIRKDIDTDTGLLPASYETYQIINPDQIVFRFTDLQNDKRSLRSALSGQRGIITSAYVAVELISDKYSPRYLNHLFRAYDLCKVFYGLGGGVRQSISFADIARLPLPGVDRPTQEAIVRRVDNRLAVIKELSPATRGVSMNATAIDRFVSLINESRDAFIVHELLGKA